MLRVRECSRGQKRAEAELAGRGATEARVASRVGHNASRFRHVMPPRLRRPWLLKSPSQTSPSQVAEEMRASPPIARSRRRACRLRARTVRRVYACRSIKRETSLVPSDYQEERRV